MGYLQGARPAVSWNKDKDYGYSPGSPSPAVRFHDHVPLHISATDHGLALLLVVLKTMALRTGDEHYSHCARFWTKIFAITSESAVSFAIAYVVFMCRHFAGKVRLPEEGY
jgi:hypothetical protein